MQSVTQCAICLEDIDTVIDRSVTACGHIFHTSCICKCCLYDHRCPLCRKQIVESPQIEESALYLNVLTRMLVGRSRFDIALHIDEATDP